MYIYSWKKMKKIWPILVILYVKSRFVILARGVQLDNGVDPPCGRHILLQNLMLASNIMHYDL